MNWFVLREDINNNKILKFDIFNHGRFADDVNKLLKKRIDKETFVEELRRILQYYFWSKSEYEVIVTEWPPHIDKKELDRLNSEYETYTKKWGHSPLRLAVSLDVSEKVDICSQVMLNFNVFAEYVWSHKKQGVCDDKR